MPLDDQDRKKGLEILKKMDLLKNEDTPVSKSLLKQIIDMLYGTIWSRTEQLSLEERSMITLTVLVALNRENELRGQNTKHYKGDLVNKYIPSLKSDLYSVQLPQVPMVTQPHPLLFQNNRYETSSQNAVVNSNVGKEIINNHTRTQRRNM